MKESKSISSNLGGINNKEIPVSQIEKKDGLGEKDCNIQEETVYLISQSELVKAIKQGEIEDPKDLEKYDPNEEW